MKITDAKTIKVEDDELEGYTQVLAVYQDNNKSDRQAIIIDSDFELKSILLCTYRLNQTISKMMNIHYDEYLKLMKNTHNFVSKTEKLDLSEEQLQRMIEKDIRGF